VILVDTSVWVEFFKGTARSGALAALLEADEVLLHSWVLGELVLGGLARGHDAEIADLRQLAASPVVADSEVIDLILSRELWGRSIGWVDAQLTASALVAGSGLWTFDRNLSVAARGLGLERGPVF